MIVKSEQQYKLLFTEMSSAFAHLQIIRDAEGRPMDYLFISVNPAFEKMIGLPADLLVGTTMKNLDQAVDPEWLNHFNEAANTGHSLQFESYSRHLNRCFEIKAYQPAREELAVIYTDTTDRRQIADALMFLLQCGSGESGEDFFQALVRFLAEKLDMDYVCIERLEKDGVSTQAVALFRDGCLDSSNGCMLLQDTPCGEVVKESIYAHGQGVRQLIPGNLLLEEMQAESLARATLLSAQGQRSARS